MSLCSLCEIKPIHIYTESYTEFHSKRICIPCTDKLSTSLIPVSNKPLQISTDIQENATISIGSWEKCTIHNHKLRLFCSTCDFAVCVLCVPMHNAHKFQSIEDLIVELVPNFYNLDFLAKAAKNDDAKEQAEAIKIFQDELCRFFSEVQEQAAGCILMKCRENLSMFEKRLKELILNYSGKTLTELVQGLKFPRKEVKRHDKYMHWVQWNSPNLFLNKLDDFSTRLIILPDGWSIPHFCRSIMVSSDEVLACGGRLQPTGNGLRKAFLIKIDPFTITSLPDMNCGRANHCLLYFLDSVYVIGGCDHDNKYTNRVERLSLHTHTWEVLASCNESRDSTTAIGLERENSIYTFGGRYINSFITNSIEKYLISSNIWVSMNIKLTFESMVLGSILISPTSVLVFGGQTGAAQPLKNCNIIDLQTFKVRETNEFAMGGCIINEPILMGDKVITYVFTSGNSRGIHEWSLKTEQWQQINHK